HPVEAPDGGHAVEQPRGDGDGVADGLSRAEQAVVVDLLHPGQLDLEGRGDVVERDVALAADGHDRRHAGTSRAPPPTKLGPASESSLMSCFWRSLSTSGSARRTTA